TAAFGRLWVPVELAGSFGWKSDNSRTKLRSEGIKANIAYIPLYLKGRFASGGDSPAEIDAQAEINGWSLDTLLRNYGTALTKMAPDFSTDATVNLKASAKGIISEDELPQVEASLQIPPAALAYLPLNIRSRIDLNASASLTPDKYATINLSGLNLKAEGLNLKASGNIDDLLGTDPRLKLNSNGTADLARLISYAPSKLGLKMDGLVNLKLNANTSRSQIESLSFPEAAVKATLEADKIRMKIPSDTIIAVLAAPKLAVVSTSGDGLASAVSADSIFFKKGMGLTARVRSMSNRAAARKIKLENGRTLTRLDFKTEDGMAMVRTGTTRAGIRDIRVTLTAMQKERVRPRISRDSLYILRQRAGANELPDFLQDKDLRAADIHISLDSTITAFIKDWSFAGNVSISRGFVATPEFPLRTRMRDFDAGFDDKTLQLRSFHLSSGTSDISAEGTLKGLRRALLGRMSVLNLDLNLNSGFINANELFAALNSRKEITADAYSDSEDDSRIVTDSLANAPIDSIPKCVVPANLLAKVRMHADSLHFGILRSSPLNGVLRARERTLQLKDANLKTNLGDAELSAFISTRTKKDMSAGLDVNMQGISVKNVLQLLPDFDSMIPALKTFDGKVNCSLSATSMLDKDMNLDLPSLKGVAKLNGQQMHISDAGSLRTVTSLLLFKNKNIGPIGDISANVAVHDNTLEVFPFEFDVDRYKLAMDGVMGITGGQDYYLSILKSPLGICFGVHLWQDDRGKSCYELCKARKLESGIPVYTKELDSLKINIAHVVRNIFLNTVKIASVHNAPVPSAQTGREISGQEYDNLQQFILDTKTQEEQDEFFDEFDTWLDKEIYNGAISAVNNVNNGQPDKKKQKQKDKK
ncbi:MAG: hypothetical protein J5764_00925, partial [Bacteroidales bacterium]|nr:hypothetical protein [Bacteroidales bacterium]